MQAISFTFAKTFPVPSKRVTCTTTTLLLLLLAMLAIDLSRWILSVHEWNRSWIKPWSRNPSKRNRFFPLLPVVHRKFESRLFTNSPVLAIRSRYLRYLAVLQRLYFRTNDALILLVRQRTFVFLDLFDTENKRSRIERIAQFSSFEIFNAVAPAPFHNSWPISNLLLRYTISVSRLSLSVFIPL